MGLACLLPKMQLSDKNQAIENTKQTLNSQGAYSSLGESNKSYLTNVITLVQGQILHPGAKRSRSLDARETVGQNGYNTRTTCELGDGEMAHEKEKTQKNEKENKNKKENVDVNNQHSESIHESQTKSTHISDVQEKFVRGGSNISMERMKGKVNTYIQTTNFNVKMGNRVFNDCVNTQYKICLIGKVKSALLPIPMSLDTYAVSQRVSMSKILAAEFISYASRFSTYTADNSVMDLAAVVEQLAAIVAAYSAVGKVSWADATAHKQVNLVVLQQHAVTHIPSNHSVFVTSTRITRDRPSILSAIIAACTAVGSVVVTDILPTTINGREAIYLQSEDSELAYGAYHALQILGANYEASSAGDVYALALTRGMHRVLTVIGHTDEGGLMRDVLRTNCYVPSYGGISLEVENYNGLPEPASSRIESFRGLVDSILLTTAALVAECDPGFEIHGRLMPIAYGTDKKDPAEWARAHQTSLVGDMGRFSTFYITGLLYIFNISGNSGLAQKMLCSTVSTDAFRRKRHIQYKTLSPFYWIESTGIIAYPIPGVSCRSRYFGAYTFEDRVIEENPFMAEYNITNSYGNSYEVHSGYGNLRAHPLLLWLSMRQDDGLHHVKLAQANNNQFINIGPYIDRGDFLEGSDLESLHLGNMRWRYSDCAAPKPTEAMYIGKGVKLLYRHIYWASGAANLYESQLLSIPSPKELLNLEISIDVSRCMGIGITDSQSAYARIQRCMSNAYKIIETYLKGNRICETNIVPSTFVFGDVDHTPQNVIREIEKDRSDVNNGGYKEDVIDNYGGSDRKTHTTAFTNADIDRYVSDVNKSAQRGTTYVDKVNTVNSSKQTGNKEVSAINNPGACGPGPHIDGAPSDKPEGASL